MRKPFFCCGWSLVCILDTIAHEVRWKDGRLCDAHERSILRRNGFPPNAAIFEVEESTIYYDPATGQVRPFNPKEWPKHD